jgi:microcystin degradation protein MlrC
LHSIVQSQRLQAWPGTVAVALIYDPEAVAQAHALGQGVEGDFSIGGRHAGSGTPLQGRMRVRACCKNAGQQLFGGDLRAPLGDSALLEIDGVAIVVNTERQQVMSPHVFTEHGLDLAQCSLLVVKSTNHFRGGFGSMASAIVLSDPPGPTTEDMSGYPWRGLIRPIWPLDDLSIDDRCKPRRVFRGF